MAIKRVGTIFDEAALQLLPSLLPVKLKSFALKLKLNFIAFCKDKSFLHSHCQALIYNTPQCQHLFLSLFNTMAGYLTISQYVE